MSSSDHEKDTPVAPSEPVIDSVETADPFDAKENSGPPEVDTKAESSPQLTPTEETPVKEEVEAPDSPVPALPPRPQNLQMDVPETFGLDRVECQSFEMASPTSPATARNLSYGADGDLSYLSGEGDLDRIDTTVNAGDPDLSSHDTTLRMLANMRALAVDDALKELPKELVLPVKEYFDTIHSNDAYIEVMSEVQYGNYDSPDKETLYALLTKSLRVSDKLYDLDTSEVDQQPFKDAVAKVGGGKLSEAEGPAASASLDGLLKVYRVLGTDSPHPLIVLLRSCIKSAKTCLILASILPKVASSRQFQFLLMRSIEDQSPEFVVDSYNSGKLTVDKLAQLLESDAFWYGYVTRVIESDLISQLADLCVVYGYLSLVDSLVKYITDDIVDSIEVKSDLGRFIREYTILDQKADAFSNDETLTKEREKTQYFQDDLSQKKEKYNDLLNNYKQLNEEKFSDETVMKKLASRNSELRSVYEQKSKAISEKLSSFEVIKANNDKNEEIGRLNENLRKEIARLTTEIQDMKLK